MLGYTSFEAAYRKLYPGASDEEIRDNYQRSVSDRGFLTSLATGLASGVYQTAGGIGTLGEMVGLPTGDWAERQYANAAEYGLPPELQGSIVDNPSLLFNPQWLAYQTGQVLPSTAAAFIPGAAVAGLSGSALAGGLTAGAIGGGLEAAGAYRESGDPWRSALYGVASGLLNAKAPITLLSGGSTLPTKLLKAATWEAATEWAEEPTQALIMGQDPWEAIVQGANVVPGTFLSTLLTGAPAAMTQSMTSGRGQGGGGNIMSPPMMPPMMEPAMQPIPLVEEPAVEAPPMAPMKAFEQRVISSEKHNFEFYSPNVEEGMTYDEAYSVVHSDKQKAALDIATALSREEGLQGETFSAIGDWEDGAENSFVTDYGEVAPPVLRRAAALHGRAFTQKAVLAFSPEEGNDSLYDFTVKDSPKGVRKVLQDNGITFRSLIEEGDNKTRVMVVDFDRSLRDNIEKVGDHYGIDIKEYPGKANLIGGDTREQGATAFTAEIAATEGLSLRGRAGVNYASQAGKVDVWPSMSQTDRLTEAAVGEYGLTDSPADAGFILSNGRMLDFSEGGGMGRTLDHRAIIYTMQKRDMRAEDREESTQNRSRVMFDWLEKTGSIRWSPESWGAESLGMPTAQQIDTLADAAEMNGGTILLEYINPRTRETIASQELTEATRTDIERFFRNADNRVKIFKQETVYGEVTPELMDTASIEHQNRFLHMIPGENRIPVTPLEQVTDMDVRNLDPLFSYGRDMLAFARDRELTSEQLNQLSKDVFKEANQITKSQYKLAPLSDFETEQGNPIKRAITGILDDIVDAGFPAHILNDINQVAMFTPKSDTTNAVYAIINGRSYLLFNTRILGALAKTQDPEVALITRTQTAHELGHVLMLSAGPGDIALWGKALFFDPTRTGLVPARNHMHGKLLHGKGAWGPVTREVLEFFGTNTAEKTGLRAYFTYPLMDEDYGIQVLNANVPIQTPFGPLPFHMLPTDAQIEIAKQMKPAAEHFTAEIFAQLHSLFYYKPEAMAKYLPVSYRFMRNVYDEAVASRNKRSAKGIRRAIQARPPRSVPVQLEAFPSRAGAGGAAVGPTGAGMEAGLRGQPATTGGGGPYALAGPGEGFAGAPQQAGAGAAAPTAYESRTPVEGEQRQPQTAEAYIKQYARTHTPQDVTDHARRGIQTWDETERLANKLGTSAEEVDKFMRRKIGRAFNSEELQQAGNLVSSEVERARAVFTDLVDRMDTTGLNDADIARGYELMLELTGLSAQFMGVRAEAGRALQIFRKLQEVVGLTKAVQQMLEPQGGRGMVAAKIRALAFAENDGEMMRAVREANKVTKWDMFMEWYINSLVSGVPTHIVNNTSNSLVQVFSDAERFVAAAIGKFHQGEKVTFEEAFEYTKAYAGGIHQGLASAARVARGEADAMTGLMKIELPHRKAIPGLLGKIVRIPGAALTVEDSFFKGLTVVRELTARAAREGLDVQATLANPPADMLAAAWEAADKLTFTQPAGPIAQALMKMGRDVPALRLIVPFIRTPSNLIKDALTRLPTAPLFSEWRAEWNKGGAAKDLAIARVGVGTTVGLAAMFMAMAGKLVGQPPDDADERRKFYLQGKQANSIRIGDKWYSFSRMEPFGILLGVVADAVELANRMNQAEAGEIVSLITGSISSNLMSKTYLRGLADLVEAMNEPERYGSRWVQKMGATATVPVMFSYMAKANDPYLRQAETLLDRIKERVPGMRETLPVRVDVFGRPISAGEGGAAYKMVSPAYISKHVADPVVDELVRLDVSMPMPQRTVRGVKLEGKTYNELVKTLGQTAYAALAMTVRSSTYQQLPDPLKRWMLDKVISDARRNARTYWYVQHPEIMKEAARKKQENFNRPAEE